MPDTIIAARLAGLTGVIVGGLITYLTTSSIERRSGSSTIGIERHRIAGNA